MSNPPQPHQEHKPHQMNLAGDAGGLAEEAVGELEVVVEPPFGGALHVARVDVKRAALALIDGIFSAKKDL